MATLNSYDLNGKKLSFANWISNLSPIDVPFTSMTGKEAVQQTLFQWQTDSLAKAVKNAVKEGEVATEGAMHSTLVKTNVTQILRKVVKVSDTANALANYGRGKELQYQMEKAGKEIKRDLEHAFLNNIAAISGDAATPRTTAGFPGLVAGRDQVDVSTGSVVHFETSTANTLTEVDIFKMTYNLYLSGSDANIIMFHPKHASLFSALQEKATVRQRIFENTPKFSVYVATLVDPLGREYKLIPNRWMPESKVYFFNPSDWTQMVLRAPQRTKLAKDGSYEKWMIEMEVGLRHRNPYASGVLELKTADTTHSPTTNWLDTTTATVKFTLDTTEKNDVVVGAYNDTVAEGKPIKVKFKTGTDNHPGRVSILKNGVEVWGEAIVNGSPVDKSSVALTVVEKSTKADAGAYSLHIYKIDDGVKTSFTTHTQVINVGTAGSNLQPGHFSLEEAEAPKARARKAKAAE